MRLGEREQMSKDASTVEGFILQNAVLISSH